MVEKTNENNNIQSIDDNNSQIVIYTSSDGKVNLDVQIDADVMIGHKSYVMVM